MSHDYHISAGKMYFITRVEWVWIILIIRPGFSGGPGGPGPRPPTNRCLPSNPSIFWLMIDVSLVILIQDFEINES